MSELTHTESAQSSATRSRRGRGKPSTRRSALVIGWIEQYCFVPEGKFLGRKVVLGQWQKEIIRAIYDNPAGTRRAIISFGRKNGKTSLAAFLLLTHLSGPAARRNAQLYSTAQSREQAGYVFALAAKIVRSSPELRSRIHIREHAKELFDPDRGTLRDLEHLILNQ